MPLLEQKCRHPTKLCRMIRTRIFTHLRFIKAVAITPRPNMLLKQQDENTERKLISLQFSMDGWTARRTQARHDTGFFVGGGGGGGRGVKARRPEYRIRTWDQNIRTHARARTDAHTHTSACTDRHMNVHAQADEWTYMYMYRRQTKRQFIKNMHNQVQR